MLQHKAAVDAESSRAPNPHCHCATLHNCRAFRVRNNCAAHVHPTVRKTIHDAPTPQTARSKHSSAPASWTGNTPAPTLHPPPRFLSSARAHVGINQLPHFATSFQSTTLESADYSSRKRQDLHSHARRQPTRDRSTHQRRSEERRVGKEGRSRR